MATTGFTGYVVLGLLLPIAVIYSKNTDREVQLAQIHNITYLGLPVDCSGKIWPKLEDRSVCNDTHYFIKVRVPVEGQYSYLMDPFPLSDEGWANDQRTGRSHQCLSVKDLQPFITIAINKVSLVERILFDVFDGPGCSVDRSLRNNHGYCFYSLNGTECLRPNVDEPAPTNSSTFNTHRSTEDSTENQSSVSLSVIIGASLGTLLALLTLVTAVLMYCRLCKRRDPRIYAVDDLVYHHRVKELSRHIENDICTDIPLCELLLNSALSKPSVFVVIVSDPSAELEKMSKLTAVIKIILVRIITELRCLRFRVNVRQEYLCLLDTINLHHKVIVIVRPPVEDPVFTSQQSVDSRVSSDIPMIPDDSVRRVQDLSSYAPLTCRSAADYEQVRKKIQQILTDDKTNDSESAVSEDDWRNAINDYLLEATVELSETDRTRDTGDDFPTIKITLSEQEVEDHKEDYSGSSSV